MPLFAARKETLSMKEIRELVPESLTAEQKLGLLLCANLNHGDADVDDACELIRNHALGSVWVTHHHPKRDEILAKIREDQGNVCIPEEEFSKVLAAIREKGL